MRFITLSSAALLCLVPGLPAQTKGGTGPLKTMSLADCIRSALERNLTLLIGDKVDFGTTAGLDAPVADLDVRSGGRLGVDRARLDLHQSYVYYDPMWISHGGQHFEATPGGFNSVSGNAVPSRSLWIESFDAGLGGNLPTGARYDLTATLNRISGQRFDTSTGTWQPIARQYRGDTVISLTQPLLRNSWIDAGRLVIKLSKKDLKLTELGFQTLVQDILRRVAITYFDLLAAREQIKVQEKALELAQQLVVENKKKVEVGTLAPLDEKQAESQAAKARADLTSTTFNAQLAENLLKSLITHDFGDIQSTTIEPSDRLIAVYQSFSLPESWRNGLENRPDYLQAKEAVERQNIVLQYRRNQLFPTLDLSAMYGRNGFGSHTEEFSDSLDDNRYAKYGGGITLSFPLTFRNERDALKKARIDREALVLSLKRREDLVKKDIDDAIKAVHSTYATTEATREARTYAEAALDAEQKKLENGKSTSFNVLQLQKDLTFAASAEIKALSDYNKALHQLYFNEGSTLERNKVTLEIK